MMKLNIQLFASGSIEFPKAGSSWKTLQGKVEWSESESSIENNTSKVHTKLYAKAGTGGTSGKGWSGNVNVNGSNHSWSSLSSSLTVAGSYALVKEFDDVITHNDDGSKTITISGSISGPSGTSIAGVTSSGSGSATLSTIARASDVSATNADIGSTSVIVINKKSSGFTTTLKYKFASQTTYTTIVEKTTATNYGWSVPTSLYSLIPNAQYGSCFIQAITYSGDTQIGDPKYANITLYANRSLCEPVISNTSIVDTNSLSVGLTGDSSKFIKYVSIPKLTWNIQTRNSATLNNQLINGTYRTSPYTSNWSDSFTLYCIDSRGYDKTHIFSMGSVVNYFYPQITANGKRKTSTSSNIILNISGKFFNGNFSDTNKNTATFECKYKRKTDNDWTSLTIEPTINEDGTFTLNDYDLGEICDYQTSCQFSIMITDKIKSGSSNFPITVGEPNYYWYKKNDLNHFRVNGQLDVKNTLNMFNYNKIYWKEPGYGDKFTIEPRFSGTDDDNYLAVRAAVGEAGTDPDTYNIATFSGKSGHFWAKGHVASSDSIQATKGFWSNGQRMPNFNGWCPDANDALYEGRYYCGGSSTNLPGSNPYGYLRVRVSNGDTINHTDNWGWQEFYNTNGRKWIRYIVNTGNWSSWQLVVQDYDVKEQPVLFNAASYMNSGQRADLSQKISEQKAGIVLIFSGYSDGSVKNYDHTTCFVPKTFLSFFSGGGIMIPMGGSQGVSGSKYIYIYDDHLEGNAANVAGNNGKYVLSQVVGV